MKTRKLLALIMTIALALTLFACGASGTGKGTPPFSKVSLDCSEDDVVKAYGECSNISTNDQGGNVYTYLSDYKGKDGAVYISFGADGKPISIQWISLPKTSDEYTELCNTLTSDLNKQYVITQDSCDLFDKWDACRFSVLLTVDRDIPIIEVDIANV